MVVWMNDVYAHTTLQAQYYEVLHKLFLLMALSQNSPTFSRPQWTPTQENHMVQLASASLDEYIDASKLTGGKTSWTLCGFNQHIPLLSRTDIPHVIASSVQLVGTIDEIVHIFKRVQPFQPFQTKEAACIGSLDTSSYHHHVALQWMRMKTPLFLKDRDACILDCRNVFIRDGKRGYACHFQSINIPECPLLNISHGYVRATIEHSGFVFTEIHPGLINVVHSLNIDFNGNYPACATLKYIKKQVALIKNLDTYIRQIRLQDAAILYPVKPHKQCPSCRKVFGVFERTKRCSGCLEQVCSDCCTTGQGYGRKVVPICIPCVLISTAKTSTSSLGVLRAQIQRNISTVDFPEEETDHKNIDRSLIQSLAASIARRSNMSILKSLEETTILANDFEFDDPTEEQTAIYRPRSKSTNGSGVWEDAIWKFHNNLERFKHHKTSRTV